jgi:vesicle transport protein SEC22
MRPLAVSHFPHILKTHASFHCSKPLYAVRSTSARSIDPTPPGTHAPHSLSRTCGLTAGPPPPAGAMVKISLICRLSDALPLAASMADEKDAYAGELETYERQAKSLVRSLASAHAKEAPGAPRDGDTVTVASGDYFCFHYMVSRGVVLLTLTEKGYPKRLAFDYLEELRREFLQSYGAKVAGATRPYEFIRFDTFIQKTKKLYVDSRTQRNLDKLNVELRDVQNIMTRNINEVIGRGERMENITQKSTHLTMESKRYSAQAKHANRMRIVKQYIPFVVVVAFVLVVYMINRYFSS